MHVWPLRRSELRAVMHKGLSYMHMCAMHVWPLRRSELRAVESIDEGLDITPVVRVRVRVWVRVRRGEGEKGRR